MINNMKGIVLLVAVLALISLAFSADYHCVGTGSVNFSTLANWEVDGSTPASLPSAGDNIYIEGDSAVTVDFGLSSLIEYGSIVIGNPSASSTQTLSISNALKAKNDIIIKGNGVLEVSDSSSLSGAAAVTVESGGEIKHNGGEVKSTGAITVKSGATYTWAKGVISATGEFAVDAGAEIVVAGAETGRQLKGKTIEVSGTLTHTATAAVEVASEIRIKADGKLNSSGSGSFSGSGMIVIKANGEADFSGATTLAAKLKNEGMVKLRQSMIHINQTYQQTSEAAVTIIDSANIQYNYESSGSAQAMTFAAGNVTLSGSIRSEGGVQIGDGTSQAYFKGGATGGVSTRDETETSTVYGTFTVKSGSDLVVDVASESDYDQIQVFGEAVYENDCGVYFDTIDGFIPAEDDKYDIVTHSSRDGTFDHFFAWGVFSVEMEYTATRTTVDITQSIGAAGSIQASLAFLAILACSVFFML